MEWRSSGGAFGAPSGPALVDDEGNGDVLGENTDHDAEISDQEDHEDESDAMEAIKLRMRQAYTFQKNAAIQEIQRARSLRQSIVNHCNSIRTMRIEREEARARAEQERLEKQRIEGEREALLISFSELPDDVVSALMEHLDARDMSALALTCRRAHRICVGHTSAWARLCYLNWGIPTSRLTPSSLVCRLSLEANEHFSPANPLLRPGASAARRRMLENRLRDTLQQREESEMRARAAQLAHGVDVAPSSSLGAIEEGDEEWEDGEEDWVATEGESQHADRMHEYGEVVERSSDAMANSGHGPRVGEHGAAAIDDAARAALAGAAGESGCKTWREVFIDRAKGWKEATRLLQWLCSMGHPSDVSGKRHRTELRAALVYLFLGTMPSGDSSASSWQRQDIAGDLRAVDSLVSLAKSKHGAVQELAAACLGNLVLGRRDLLEQATSLTGRGRDMVPNLSSSVTGVVRESSRALVNLWAPGVTAHGLTGGGFGGTGAWGGSGGSDVANGSGDGRYGGAGVIDIAQTRAIALSAVLKAADMASVPPVIPLSRMAGHIRPGQWVVQEFSSRGEPFQTLLVSMSEADRSTKGASDVETGVVRLQGILAGIRRTFEAPTVAAPDVEGISGDDIETGAASRLGAAVSRREDEGFSPPGREAPVEGWWVPESGEIVVLFAGFDGDYGRPGRPLGALGLFGTRDEVGAWGIACKCTVGDKAPPIGGSRRVFRMYPINGLV